MSSIEEMRGPYPEYQKIRDAARNPRASNTDRCATGGAGGRRIRTLDGLATNDDSRASLRLQLSASGNIPGTRQRLLLTAAERNPMMLVGGVPIDERVLRELSRVVDGQLGRRLDTALHYRAKVLGLTVAEREAILRALENSPPGLSELRAILLQDPRWRSSERLT